MNKRRLKKIIITGVLIILVTIYFLNSNPEIRNSIIFFGIILLTALFSGVLIVIGIKALVDCKK